MNRAIELEEWANEEIARGPIESRAITSRARVHFQGNIDDPSEYTLTFMHVLDTASVTVSPSSQCIRFNSVAVGKFEAELMLRFAKRVIDGVPRERHIEELKRLRYRLDLKIEELTENPTPEG